MSRSERAGPMTGHVEVCVRRAADLRHLRSVVTSCVAAHGAPANARDEIVLAVQEAVKNGLAACGGPNHAVDVKLRCDERGCMVEVRDPGPGFDLAAMRRRTLDAGAENGRGLLLMSRLMDSLAVRCDGACTVVMTRRFSGRDRA